MLSIVELPEDVLLNILQFCKVQDLLPLSATCSLFNRLAKDPFLWKHLCYRDFHVFRESCERVSFEKIYKNLLHKYGYMLGLYQSQIGPYGGLLEIRFKADVIEGVLWEPSADLTEPLRESITFSVSGDTVPATCLCIPNICPHQCSLHIDKRNGTVTQHCSDYRRHIQAICNAGHDTTDNSMVPINMKIVYLNEALGPGLVHRPLILPKPNDIPSILRRKDGSLPRQIITPGLFKGTYSVHGIEILLFRYKDEHEIHGLKVTGDNNVHAGKISVKILLRYPADTPTADRNSILDLSLIDAKPSAIPLEQIPEQSFYLPDGCSFEAAIQLPSTCIARYHGFGQIAYEGFQRPTYTPTQVIIFSDDLLGVIWMELSSFSLFSRVDKTFMSNVNKTGKSCL